MENICSLDDGTESESERVNRESGRLADMGHCRSPNYFVRCGACVCVYVCACVPVYLCVCVYCIGAEAAHAYLLVTHTQPAQRETDAETPAANFLIKDPLPYSTYIGFNPFPRLAPPNVTVQSLLPPPPASAQTPPAHCLSTSIFRPQWAPTVEPNKLAKLFAICIIITTFTITLIIIIISVATTRNAIECMHWVGARNEGIAIFCQTIFRPKHH